MYHISFLKNMNVILLTLLIMESAFSFPMNNSFLRNTIRVVGGELTPPIIEEKLIFLRIAVTDVYGTISTGRCSGTIITSWHILTAAHCFSPGGSGEAFKVEICIRQRYEQHCKWDYEVVEYYRPIMYSHNERMGDLAVARLSRNIDVNIFSYMDIFALGTIYEFMMDHVFVSGSGPTSSDESVIRSTSAFHNTARICIMSMSDLNCQRDCQCRTDSSIQLDREKFIFGTGLDYKAQDCGLIFGDSGGPLFVIIENVPYIVGVSASFETRCYYRKKISVFTNIYHFKEDIKEIIISSKFPRHWEAISVRT